MREKTCCFSGHRTLPTEECKKISDRLEDTIIGLYHRGIFRFEAGGALGFDTIAAQTVLRLREKYSDMKLILILPCLAQTRGWDSKDILEYDRIRAQADQVIYTSQEYTRGCMHKRNRRLVDTSSVCVCYLRKSKGGTVYTVNYAKTRGAEIINIA